MIARRQALYMLLGCFWLPGLSLILLAYVSVRLACLRRFSWVMPACNRMPSQLGADISNAWESMFLTKAVDQACAKKFGAGK
jgi:hypothetical protein